MATPRLCFVTLWVDPNSGVQWSYQLFYYPETQEVEMMDIKNRRQFLKKVKYEALNPNTLFIGSQVTVFARQLKVVEYGDDYTRSQIESKSERTLAMVKPDAFKHLGKIVNAIQQSGFLISNMRVCKLSRPETEDFYSVHRGKPFYPGLVDFMTSGRVCAMELVAAGAIRKWRDLLGPTDSGRARSEAPDSIRGTFGTDNTRNAAHGSDAPDTAAHEIGFFFAPGRTSVGRCDVGRNTTLGLIKPHLVEAGAAGLVLDVMQDGFQITAAQMFSVDRTAAAEFYEVYKGVIAAGEFNAMVEELISGPCIAVEVADKDGANPVEPFRELCGPMDPELGRVLRPSSLRAQFGLTRTRNGVHCTDLPEDGLLEVQYFFSILAAA